MTLDFCRTRIRIHGILPILWLLAGISGAGSTLIPTFLALLLHESGHLLAAKLLKMRVDSIEITPYGGVISIENMDRAPAHNGFLLAFAGPLFSFLGCLLAGWLCYSAVSSFEFAQNFARGNLILLLFNLLPALPLDGGRMLRSILGRFCSHAKTTKVLTSVGVMLGFILCGLSFALAIKGKLNLSPIFAGVYLIYASAMEQKQGIARYISALITRRQKLERNEIIPVEMIAASEHTSALSLLNKLSPGKYHRIAVLTEDGMELLAMIEEEILCAALLQTPQNTLKDIIKNGQSIR